MLQGNRTPVEGVGQQERGIAREQRYSKQGGTSPGDSSGEIVEQKNGDGSGQKDGDAERIGARRENFENRPVEIGFESARIRDDHQGRMVPKDLDRIGQRRRDEERGGE